MSDISVGDCSGTGSGALKNGQQAQFIVTGCTNIVDEKFSEEVTLTYAKEGGLEHVTIGKIEGKVSSGVVGEGLFGDGGEETGAGGEGEAYDPGMAGGDPLPSGRQRYFFSNNPNSPQIYEAIINPLDVHVGDTQIMTISVRDTVYAITSVTAAIETDNSVRNEILSLISGTESDGTWQGSWVVVDTHSATYRTTFTATNSKGETASETLTWTDPCAPPVGGDWTLDGACDIDAVNGVDNGDFTVEGFTMTINAGGTFVWNDGKTVYITTGSIAMAEGARIRKGFIYMTDQDDDRWPSSTTQAWGFSAPANSQRRSLMLSSTSTDCLDTNAFTYQNVNVVTDADQDGYSTSGTDTQTCVGNSSTISGDTYYMAADGNFDYSTAAAMDGTADPNDDNSAQNTALCVSGHTDNLDGTCSFEFAVSDTHSWNCFGGCYNYATRCRATKDNSDSDWMSFYAWDTSAIPDDATVDSAELRYYTMDVVDTTTRNLQGEYYSWAPTAVSGDWASTVTSNAFTATATSVFVDDTNTGTLPTPHHSQSSNNKVFKKYLKTKWG